MKKLFIFVFILAGLLLASCQGAAPEPTATLAPNSPPATETPVEEPTEAVESSEGEMADYGEGDFAGALWASDWQWISFTSPVEQFDIDMPENYQLIFFDDGTFQVVADCNNAGGAFFDEDGSLTIEMFQSTLALCPGDSRSEQFIELIGGAAQYFFEDGDLFIDLMADGGTLVFAPVPVPDLFNTPWQWISFTGNSGHFDVDSPESYMLTLFEDGSLSIEADCNTVLSDYTIDGESLTIAPGATTLALCPGDSRSEQFVQRLVSAQRYLIERNNLFVVVEEDGGTMVFGLADEMAVDAPSITANPWQWTSFTNPVEQFELEQPESYQLAFNTDGTFNAVADCNNALGSYTDEAGALTIEFGPMTLVACPEDSRSDQFVQYLMGAARYFFEDGNLYIDLMADGGTMVFAPGSEDAMQGSLPADLIAQLDAYMQSQVYTEGGNPGTAAPGLVLYVETPEGRYLNAAGVANLEDGTPIQVEDHLEIGSNTKSMTIVLLLQLAEEGLLSLDDPLSQYLPEQAALFADGDQITLRQLAQHTAGLYDYADNIMAVGIVDPAALEASYTPEELVQYAAENGAPYFAPGEEFQWHYSNTGYILLGMVIEKVTGESLADLYQTRIFNPLGLESAVLIAGVPQTGEITTHGYYWQDDQSIDTTNWNGSQGWAAGAVAMTAADLATYGKALAAGELFQSPETLDEMLAFNEDSKFGVGGSYGLGLIDFAGDGTVWGHGGQSLGFQSLWFTKPETGLMVVGLTNSASYEAYAFLNVLNIVEGAGALPIGPITLLPVGSLVSTEWRWVQFISPTEMVDIDAATGPTMKIGKDQSVIVSSPECGLAFGTYTVDGAWIINFDIDASTFTCEADAQAALFVQYLNDAAIWRFDNGQLIVELPADAGSMIFDLVPLE